MSHTVIMRQEGLPDAGLRAWLLDADPTGIEAFADEAARRSMAVPSAARALLVRGSRHPEALPPHVAAFTDTVEEALNWGPYAQTRSVPVARILAVVHHPDTNTTEYVVATKGLAS